MALTKSVQACGQCQRGIVEVRQGGTVRKRPSSAPPPDSARPKHLALRRQRWLVAGLATLVAVAGAGWAVAGLVSTSVPGREVAATTRRAETPQRPVLDVPGRRVVAEPMTPRADGWRSVLQHFDYDRARAWQSGDPAALGAVYLRRSVVLRRDRRTMRAYVERGLRVRGAHLRFAAIAPVRRSRGVVLLRVVDRLAQTSVVASTGVERDLPRDEVTAHTLRLERQDGTWRIAAAWPQ